MPSTPAVRRLLAVAATVAATAGLAGCEDDVTDPTGAVAFVVGARSNMPAPQLDGRALEVLDEAVDRQSLAALVVADGTPTVAGTLQLDVEGANDVARDQSRQENRLEIADGIAGVRADDAETDLLTALDLAVRSISSVDEGGRTVVVVDSGLSTAGALDFAADPALLQADAQQLAGRLRDAGQLPDLAGVAVVFQGLGDTFAPQPALDRPDRTALVEIWTAIAEAAGAQSVTVEQTPLGRAPSGELPPVTPVTVAGGRTCSVTLTEEVVRFVADRAEFLDRDTAVAALAPLARQLSGQGVTALLTGTTADVGDDAGQLALSRERAEAVRGVLQELGVPEGRITAQGLGSDFEGYVPDHDAQGDLIPEAAAANRKVVVQLAGGSDLVCG